MSAGESPLSRVYRLIYDGICGHPPNLRLWHYQWLDTFYLYRRLRKMLPTLTGRVLDAGCGAAPYRNWFGEVSEYVGLDVFSGPQVDVVVAPDEPWPFSDEYFDVVLSSQVLEHVEHLEHTLAEMKRVIKKRGVMVLSTPFLYNEHGAPYDFQRFTAHHAVKLFQDFEILNMYRLGGIGSTLTILFLNWVEQSMNSSFAMRLLKAPLLPIWLVISFILNVLGVLLDRIDRTDAFYNNVLVVVRKSS